MRNPFKSDYYAIVDRNSGALHSVGQDKTTPPLAHHTVILLDHKPDLDTEEWDASTWRFVPKATS